MSDRLEELTAFVRAGETGSFSRVARELGVSQPPHWQVNPEVHRRFAERATQEAVERERNREMLQEMFAHK